MTQSREDLEARIAAYIDGQLPPADAARLEVFLANTDPQLAEQIIGMLNDRHRLRTLPKPTAPPDLAARVMEQVERATLLNDVEHFSHPGRPWWQSRLAIAAGFILVFGGFSWIVAVTVVGGGHHDNWDNPSAKAPSKIPAATSSPIAAPTDATILVIATPRKDAPAFERSKSSEIRSSLAAKSGDAPSAPLDPVASAAKTSAAGPAFQPDESVVLEHLARNREVAANGQSVASKLGYTPVDSSAHALSNILLTSGAPAPEPVVITLVARDSQDFTRLRMALEDILNQDPASARHQAALQIRYMNTVTNTLTNSGINNSINNDANTGANNSVTGSAPEGNDVARRGNGKLAAADNGAAAHPTDTSGNGTSLNFDNNGYNFYDAKNKQFNYLPETPAPAVADTPEAQKKTEETPPAANGPDPKAADQQLTDQKAADRKIVGQKAAARVIPSAGAPPAPAQAASQSAPQAAPQYLQQSVQFHGTLAENASTYRVALRNDQLQQLASQFHVDSISSGRQAYVITPDKFRDADKRFDAALKDDKDTLKFSGGAGTGGRQAAAPKDFAKTAPDAPAALNAPAANAAADLNQEKEQNEKAQILAAASAPASASTLFKSTPWLEVIITMQPAPAATTAPAAPQGKTQAPPPLTK